MRRLLSVLASRSGNLLRYASIATALEIDQKTVKSYVELLEAIFLIRTLPAWRPSFRGPTTSATGTAPRSTSS